MGVDVLYQRMNVASTSNGIVPLGVIPAGTNTVNKFNDDQDNLQVRFRVHRDFYP